MNGNTQNNPFVIGGLVSILVGALVMTFLQLRGSDGAPPVVTPVPSAAATRESHSIAHDRSARDPFYHPALKRILANGPLLGGSHVESTRKPEPAVSASRPLPGLFSGPLGSRPGVEPANVFPPASNPPAGPAMPEKPAGGISNGDASDIFVQGLKVTAVVSGKRRSVVVEGAGPLPMTVHAGDRVGELRVVAIHATEMVLSGKGGLWTLPIPVVPQNGADDSPRLKEEADAPH